jgi:hypothetical protein
MRYFTICLMAVAVALSGCNLSGPASVADEDDPVLAGPAKAGGTGLPGRTTILRVVGTGVAYEGPVPDIDGDGEDDTATCFDVALFDAAGRKVGTATDCLSNIEEVGDGLALVGTTIFRLRNGTFTSRGNTTVQPVTTDAPTPITHTTGAVPMEGDNGIIAGTGAYRNFKAQVRLGGAVNLSRLDSDGEITFDCLFSVAPLKGR